MTAGAPYTKFVMERRAEGLCRCGQKLAHSRWGKRLTRCRACLDKASACAMRRKERKR